MAAMPPGRRIAEGGPRPIVLLVGLGQEKLRDWFRGFAVLREPCELGPRLEGGFADKGDSVVLEIIIAKNWGKSCSNPDCFSVRIGG
jgi:hypothetical protein